jgi:hypothetical protein
VLWVIPVLALLLAGALIGGAVGAGLMLRWMSRRRWRFDSMARSWEHQGETFSSGVCYASPDDDGPEPEHPP